MAGIPRDAITVISIDIGKNSFHVVGLDGRGTVALRHPAMRPERPHAQYANVVHPGACSGTNGINIVHFPCCFS